MKSYFWPIAWQASLFFSLNHALARQTPYHGEPIRLPAVIQAEDFDHGGEGIAFHVAVPSIPSEDSYRYTVVPLHTTSDTSGGYDVPLAPGDWLEYTIEIPEPGLFELTAWLGIFNHDVSIFELSLDGKDLTGGVAVYRYYDAGWYMASQQPLVLPAGIHTLRLTMKEIWYYDWGHGGALTDAQPTDGFKSRVDWIKLRPVLSLRPAQYLAGADVPGFADGPGLSAQFSANVTGMDVDALGNVYLADAGNYRIRKVTPAGEVSTLAGDGTQGWVDGPGSTAQFYDLTAWGNSLVVDESGTVLVLDRPPGTNAVRTISQDGTVSTYYQDQAKPSYVSLFV